MRVGGDLLQAMFGVRFCSLQLFTHRRYQRMEMFGDLSVGVRFQVVKTFGDGATERLERVAHRLRSLFGSRF